ncbi:hypothetical protein MMC25_007592 [Agyrium rufum]|nr:hypothetical protein [Agyrium rufum]
MEFYAAWEASIDVPAPTMVVLINVLDRLQTVLPQGNFTMEALELMVCMMIDQELVKAMGFTPRTLPARQSRALQEAWGLATPEYVRAVGDLESADYYRDEKRSLKGVLPSERMKNKGPTWVEICRAEALKARAEKEKKKEEEQKGTGMGDGKEEIGARPSRDGQE